jgi:hypothetical protein
MCTPLTGQIRSCIAFYSNVQPSTAQYMGCTTPARISVVLQILECCRRTQSFSSTGGYGVVTNGQTSARSSRQTPAQSHARGAYAENVPMSECLITFATRCSSLRPARLQGRPFYRAVWEKFARTVCRPLSGVHVHVFPGRGLIRAGSFTKPFQNRHLLGALGGF